MPKTRQQKKEIVTKLQDKLSKMASLVFVDFTNLKTEEIEKLRRLSKKEGAEYLVAKKTLFDHARQMLPAGNLGGFEVGKLQGEIGFLFGYGDEIAPMRLSETFARDHKELKIRGGIQINQTDKSDRSYRFLSAGEVLALAKLPSKLELLAKVVGSLQAPLSGMVSVLQGNLRGLVYALSQIKK